MPPRCSAIGCKNLGRFSFPLDPKLLFKWRVALKRKGKKADLWIPSTYSKLCDKHFKKEDLIVYKHKNEREFVRVKKGSVPSIFQHSEKTELSLSRQARAKRRSDLLKKEEEAMLSLDTVEVTIENMAESKSHSKEEDEELKKTKVMTTQTDVTGPFMVFRIDNFISRPEMILFYTGFSNIKHFNYFYSCLGSAASNLKYQSLALSSRDELFLCLCKLRTNKKFKELALLFGISESTAERIFHVWLSFLYHQLKELDIWLPKEVVDQYMPTDFAKNFPKTRVILDATEIPIEKPNNVQDQAASWSTYKNSNTIKTMIGIAPRGVVTFVSDSYGGSTSDRQIIERSNLMDQCKFNKGDDIMADRGIQVEDLFVTKNVNVNKPTFLRGKSQLSPEDVIRDRRISSKRIHVERIIGYAKSFQMLSEVLDHSFTLLADRIIFVCFAICNFRPNIVN